MMGTSVRSGRGANKASANTLGEAVSSASIVQETSEAMSAHTEKEVQVHRLLAQTVVCARAPRRRALRLNARSRRRFTGLVSRFIILAATRAGHCQPDGGRRKAGAAHMLGKLWDGGGKDAQHQCTSPEQKCCIDGQEPTLAVFNQIMCKCDMLISPRNPRRHAKIYDTCTSLFLEP